MVYKNASKLQQMIRIQGKELGQSKKHKATYEVAPQAEWKYHP